MNVVDDAFTEKDIVGIFCNKYTDLYNNVSDDSFNETVTTRVTRRVHTPTSPTSPLI